MKAIFRILFVHVLVVTSVYSQGFNISSNGLQTFNIKDEQGRNQATFLSEAPFENITGISNDVWGHISFDPADVKSTLQGEVSISAASLKTGIDQRDEQLQSISWLCTDKFPDITFLIKEVISVELLEDNRISLVVSGDFSLRGKTKQIYAKATMKYLYESELTKTIMPGDLVGISAMLDINLADFGIEHQLIGKRVANKVKITVSLRGSNQLL